MNTFSAGHVAPPRRPLTAIIPTRNEEENLPDCLDSVAFADEVLVVDSFSSDATVAIAKARGARVLQHEYGYSALQKNWAIPQASHEWILLVDADERVTAGLREEILALLRTAPTRDGYWIRRANYFLGRHIRHGGWESDRVIRLFRRDVSRYRERRVHAEIDLPGPLPTLRHALEHHTFRSFDQYWHKLRCYSEWGAAQLDSEGRRTGPLQIFGAPAARFFKMYLLRLGFLEGIHGLVLSMLNAFTVYMKYARLWEMNLRRDPQSVSPNPREVEGTITSRGEDGVSPEMPPGAQPARRPPTSSATR